MYKRQVLHQLGRKLGLQGGVPAAVEPQHGVVHALGPQLYRAHAPAAQLGEDGGVDGVGPGGDPDAESAPRLDKGGGRGQQGLPVGGVDGGEAAAEKGDLDLPPLSGARQQGIASFGDLLGGCLLYTSSVCW